MGDVSLTYYSSLKSIKTEWLWYPYIPKGKITLILGDPGCGKTYMILKLISSLTVGEPLPLSEAGIVTECLYQNYEDGLEDTIRPRLIKNGADCSKISFISDEDVAINDARIETAITDAGVCLLVLDPIQSFISEDTDINRVNTIRPKLRFLKEVAERTNCAVVLIGHMNKSGGKKSIYRSLGSIDLTAAARSVLLVGQTNIDDSERIVMQTKNNLAPKGDPLAFCINDGIVEWLGIRSVSEEELLNGAKEPVGENDSKLMSAAVFLGGLLANGSVPATYATEKAKDSGIRLRTLERAKALLGVKSEKENGKWLWSLPEGRIDE